jgi:hypothetical protein
MANQAIAELIATHLGTGLPHPGRPETNEAPRALPLAAFRTAGLPAEMADMVVDTAHCVGEAIVHLVELSGSVIIERAELDELRAADDQPGEALPVVCTSCKQPILYLRVVNGRALINPLVLGGINHNCPHRMEATP